MQRRISHTLAGAALLFGAGSAATAQASQQVRRISRAHIAVENAEADLRNAQTVVEAYASGVGHYPRESRPTALSSALVHDADAASLPGVSYRGLGAHTDTYVLSAYVPNVKRTYWLATIDGYAYYGSTRGGTAQKPRAPAPGTRAGSPNPWT